MDEVLVVTEEVKEKPKKDEKKQADRFTGIRVSHGYSWVGYKMGTVYKKVPHKEGLAVADHKFFTDKEFDALEKY